MIWKDIHPAVNLARLQLLSPENIYREIIENADTRGLPFMRHEIIDLALLKRNDLLINLGLAEYSGTREVIAELYKNAKLGSENPDYDCAIKLACLKNTIYQQIGILNPPVAIETDELLRILQEGSDDEIVTLLSNPNCTYLISELFSRKAPFNQIPMNRLGRLLSASRYNKGLYENYTESLGGGTDPPIWSRDIFKAVGELLGEAPINVEWFWYLHGFLDEIYKNASIYHFPQVTLTKVFDLLNRWNDIELRSAIGVGVHRQSSINWLDHFRCLISIFMAPHVGEDNYVSLNQSDDIAVRCLFYAHRKLSPSEMEQYFEQERNVYLLGAVSNSHIYFKPECRIILEKQVHTYYCFMYKNRCEALKAIFSNSGLGDIILTKNLSEFFDLPTNAAEKPVDEMIGKMNEKIDNLIRKQRRFGIFVVALVTVFVVLQILKY